MLLPMRLCLVAYLVCLSWCASHVSVCPGASLVRIRPGVSVPGVCMSLVSVCPWYVCAWYVCAVRALFFSAVQMNIGSKSVRTVRRMCHGLPLRVGFL